MNAPAAAQPAAASMVVCCATTNASRANPLNTLSWVRCAWVNVAARDVLAAAGTVGGSPARKVEASRLPRAATPRAMPSCWWVSLSAEPIPACSRGTADNTVLVTAGLETGPTFQLVVRELTESLALSGFRRVVIVNAHRGNDELIKATARDLNEQLPASIAATSYWTPAWADLAAAEGLDRPRRIPGHAGQFETSLMLAITPELDGRISYPPDRDEPTPTLPRLPGPSGVPGRSTNRHQRSAVDWSADGHPRGDSRKRMRIGRSAPIMSVMSVWIEDPVRLGETELPGGGKLGWAEWGPAEGMAVLLIPGAATSRRLGFGAEVRDRLGVRLISIDRPGLGVSTPLPDHSFVTVVAAIDQLATARGLDRPPVVGYSQGAPFALAYAATGLSGPLAIVSGTDEVAAPQFAGSLPAPLRHLVDLVASDPVAAQGVFAGFDPEAMWQHVTQASPESDLLVYQEPAFEATYRRAMTEAFGQGPAGYAHDTMLAMDRWPFDLSRITIRVDLWYGAHDISHSPDQGATLADRIPGARRRVVPDIGGALLWTHAEPILRSLLG